MAYRYRMTTPQKKALTVATLIALIFGAYFLRQYLTLIIFAVVLAFLFNPFYLRRLRRNNNSGRSAAQTFLFAMLVILLPLAIVLMLTVLQIDHTINHVTTTVQSTDISAASEHLINSINNLLAKTSTSFRLTPEWIQSAATHLAQKIGAAFLSNLSGYAGSFFSFFTTAIIFIFVFLSLLRNQQVILKMLRNLNPLSEEVGELYLNRVSAMTKAMVRGQFVVATLQGATDAALIYLGGFHQAFFFLLMILVALSFVPLGGGILAIPIGIIMALTGNVAGGVLVVAGHILIVTNIDNVLRPRLVPPEARLDSALTILSVFSGIALLGFLGIVIGPVIMVILVTTIQVYEQVYGRTETVAAQGRSNRRRKPPFWRRLWHNEKAG